MRTPVLHLLAGPNGAGKSAFVARVLAPITHLPFVNADEIAAATWPGEELEQAYEASRAAATLRRDLLDARRSFITETVFSHRSKVELVEHATTLGYVVRMHIILVPLELTVRRVEHRVATGGHQVPEAKIRERYERLWPLVVEARDVAERADVYDNSLAATPYRKVASYRNGRLVGDTDWPSWTPEALRA